MTKLQVLFVILATLADSLIAEIVPVFAESFEDCTKPQDKAGVCDFSSMEVIAEDSTHSFLNGSFKFLKDLKAPWDYKMYTERFERGQWNVFAFNKRVKDFCTVMHKSSEPWYNFYKHVPACPALGGSQWLFNMVPIKFSFDFKPPFVGKWRLTCESEFKIDGVIKKECYRMNFDIIEI